jgi:predicted PurR-regulated permease PerM
MSRNLSLIVLGAVLLVIGFFAFRVLATFLVPLFLAVLLVVVFHPVHQRLLAWCRGRRHPAALLTTVAVMLVVLVPSGLVITLAAAEGVALVKQFDPQNIQQRLSGIRTRLGLEVPQRRQLRTLETDLEGLLTLTQDRASAAEQQTEVHDLLARIDALQTDLAKSNEKNVPSLAPLRNALKRIPETKAGTLDNQDAARSALLAFQEFRTELLGGPLAEMLKTAANPGVEDFAAWKTQAVAYLQQSLAPAAGATGLFVFRLVLGTAIMIVSLYFFFADGPAFINAITRLLPLEEGYVRELIEEFDSLSRAVVLATLISALVQGILAGFGFWVAGVGAVFLLMLLTILCALIPFIGAATVWICVCLWLVFYEDRWLAASLLAVYGTAIVSMSDNVVKPLILHGRSNLHPLLALLSILGGVQALGPIGILIGPMIVAFLQTLLKILHRELTALNQEEGEANGEEETAGKDVEEAERESTKSESRNPKQIRSTNKE